MSDKARSWEEIMKKPMANAPANQSFEKRPMKWTHEHENAGAELLAILNREKPSDPKARIFPSTGDSELDKLCR